MSTKKIPKQSKALILSGGGGRGAYQVGVWKYLKEKNWAPDLICGTSIGAINGSLFASNTNLNDILSLWMSINRQQIFRTSISKYLFHPIFKKKFHSLLNTAPLKELITYYFNKKQLMESPIDLIITAVNILNGKLHLFPKQDIKIEHLLASSAMPSLFSWPKINNEYYWDGGVMANVPIFPAIQQNISEVIVVLLSPIGVHQLPMPKNPLRVTNYMVEQFLSGSYFFLLSHLLSMEKNTCTQRKKALSENQKEQDYTPVPNLNQNTLQIQNSKIYHVAPKKILGLNSFLKFSKRKKEFLIELGYHDAQEALSHL